MTRRNWDEALSVLASDAPAAERARVANKLEAFLSDCDFSREFAGYLAAAAEAYCKSVNEYHRTLEEPSAPQPWWDTLSETYTGVFSAAYEWRKREDRALGHDLAKETHNE